jgi:hypothetical protein
MREMSVTERRYKAVLAVIGGGRTVRCPARRVRRQAGTRFQAEAFQDDLVGIFAPDALAAKDARLQSDLVTADVALDAMASAPSAGDQITLQAAHNSLIQALGRADSDAADVAKGV